MFVLGAVMMVLFALRQRQLMRSNGKHVPPLIPLSLFGPGARNLLTIYLGCFLTWAGVEVSRGVGLGPQGSGADH